MGDMIVVTSTHEGFLSNSYLVGSGEGGDAIIIDTGGPMEPLLVALDEHDLELQAIFNTHDHQDHTTFNVEWLGRHDVPLHTASSLSDGQRLGFGELEVQVLATPGHVPEHVALVVGGEAVFTGDALFAGSVGGTLHGGPDGYEQLRTSVMDQLLALPDSMRVWPGHAEPTTIGDERATNPFVRFWARGERNADEEVHVAGHPATVHVMARDYDGGQKALVGMADGSWAIVGGSSLEHDAASALTSSRT